MLAKKFTKKGNTENYENENFEGENYEVTVYLDTFFSRLRTFYQCREDKTKFPGFLCPDYPGFLSITDNYFFDALANVLEDPNMDCR